MLIDTALSILGEKRFAPRPQLALAHPINPGFLSLASPRVRPILAVKGRDERANNARP
jgi:hypothetical protein